MQEIPPSLSGSAICYSKEILRLSVPKKSQSQKNRCVFKSQSTKSQVLPQKSQENRQKITEEIAENR